MPRRALCSGQAPAARAGPPAPAAHRRDPGPRPRAAGAPVRLPSSPLPLCRLAAVPVAAACRDFIAARHICRVPGRAAYGEEVSELTRGDFENLLAFRTSLRRFLHWSQTLARAAGLTPAQHQLLVAIKGHPGGREPTIGDLAGYLLLRHHSAVELVDRAAAARLSRACGQRTGYVRIAPLLNKHSGDEGIE